MADSVYGGDFGGEDNSLAGIFARLLSGSLRQPRLSPTPPNSLPTVPTIPSETMMINGQAYNPLYRRNTPIQPYPAEFYAPGYAPGGGPSPAEKTIQWPGGDLLLAMNTANAPISPHIEDRRNLPRSPVPETSMFKGNPLGTPMEPMVPPDQLRTNSMFAPMRYDDNGNLLTNKPAPTWTRHGK